MPPDRTSESLSEELFTRQEQNPYAPNAHLSLEEYHRRLLSFAPDKLHLFSVAAIKDDVTQIIDDPRKITYLEETAVDHSKPAVYFFSGEGHHPLRDDFTAGRGRALQEILECRQFPGILQAFIGTYPHSQTADFRQQTSNTLGEAGAQYSPLSMRMAEHVIGPLREYTQLKEDERAKEIEGLKRRLRLKVFIGYSHGSTVLEGLQHALVHMLKEKHYPEKVIAEEIMPNVKIVAYAGSGLFQRHAGQKDTGATSLYIMNMNDIAAFLSAVTSAHAQQDTVTTEGLRGNNRAARTTITPIGANARFAVHTIRNTLIQHIPYDPANRRDVAESDIIQKSDKFYTVRTVTSRGGHLPDRLFYIAPDDLPSDEASDSAPIKRYSGRHEMELMRNVLAWMIEDTQQVKNAIDTGTALPVLPSIDAMLTQPKSLNPNPTSLRTAEPEIYRKRVEGILVHPTSRLLATWQAAVRGVHNETALKIEEEKLPCGLSWQQTTNVHRQPVFALNLSDMSPDQRIGVRFALSGEAIPHIYHSDTATLEVPAANFPEAWIARSADRGGIVGGVFDASRLRAVKESLSTDLDSAFGMVIARLNMSSSVKWHGEETYPVRFVELRAAKDILTHLKYPEAAVDQREMAWALQTIRDSYKDTPNGNVVRVMERAAELLGISFSTHHEMPGHIQQVIAQSIALFQETQNNIPR